MVEFTMNKQEKLDTLINLIKEGLEHLGDLSDNLDPNVDINEKVDSNSLLMKARTNFCTALAEAELLSEQK